MSRKRFGGHFRMNFCPKLTTPALHLLFPMMLPIVFAGCGLDMTDENHYSNLEEVKADGAIMRGWIPDCIPASAKDIHEWHNLDSNECFGSFSFEKEEYAEFTEEIVKLAPVGSGFKIQLDKRMDWPYRFPRKATPSDLESNGFGLFTCDNIYLAVNGSAGHAYFWHK